MTHDYRGELDCVVRAAATAGTMLRQAFHSGEREIDHQAEEEIRKTLTASFPQYGYRGEELGFVSPPHDSAGHLWLVDPDDGTAAFEKGFRGASVSIALLRDGRPVLGVVYAYCAPDDAGDWFTWAEGAGPVRRNGSAIPGPGSGVPETVLVSHQADRNPHANATLAAPMRFRAVPSIAYRLALVAVGEARAAVSLNGPVGWDYAGGHALLLGADMELYDQMGEPIRYDRNGNSSCGGRCFGGGRSLVQELAGREWNFALRRPHQDPEPYRLCWPNRKCTVSDAGLLSRAQGSMLGQLAGDALGGLVEFEFETATQIQRSHPAGVRLLVDGGHWNTLGGQPTDDSEMALALVRSVVNHGAYEPEAAARAYAWWYKSNPYDIGNTTRAAVSAAAGAVRAGQSAAEASRNAALRNSQANGALMRVSPLGILGAGAEEGKSGEWAGQDAMLTHPNPVCQHANTVFAQALAFAIRTGSNAEQVYRFAVEMANQAQSPQSITDVLIKSASEPPDDYSRQKGWVLIALQNAFWQLLHAVNLEEGIVNTVMSGGDTDTNAAITGALLGAVHGRSAIPVQWLDRILSCRPIAGIAGVQHPRPSALWPVDALWIAERLVWLGAKAKIDTGGATSPPGRSGPTETTVEESLGNVVTRSGKLKERERPTRHWDGVIRGNTRKPFTDKHRVQAALESADWAGSLRLLRDNPNLVNAILSKRSSWSHVLHQAVRCHAPAGVVDELVALGAFRSITDSSGRRPMDIAMEEGFEDLVASVQPAIEHPVDPGRLARIQELFHGLIRSVMLVFKVPLQMRLPQLSVLTEVEDLAVWFPIPGMYGGFQCWLENADDGAVLITESWCRVSGEAMRHRITPFEVVLVEEDSTISMVALS